MYKGVTTSELDELAAETAASMTANHPDYAVVGRLPAAAAWSQRCTAALCPLSRAAKLTLGPAGAAGGAGRGVQSAQEHAEVVQRDVRARPPVPAHPPAHLLSINTLPRFARVTQPLKACPADARGWAQREADGGAREPQERGGRAAGGRGHRGDRGAGARPARCAVPGQRAQHGLLRTAHASRQHAVLRLCTACTVLSRKGASLIYVCTCGIAQQRTLPARGRPPAVRWCAAVRRCPAHMQQPGAAVHAAPVLGISMQLYLPTALCCGLADSGACVAANLDRMHTLC